MTLSAKLRKKYEARLKQTFHEEYGGPTPKEDTREVLALIEQVEYLRWMWTHADFGPADGDVKDSMQKEWMEKTGKRPPEGWDYGRNGEKLP